jgi:hypothetical protein
VAAAEINLVLAPGLGRKVRLDPPEILGRSTVHFLLDALRTGNTARARELFDYLVFEHRTVLGIYEVWDWELVHYLVREGGQEPTEVYRTTLLPWLAATLGPGVASFGLKALGRVLLEGRAGHLRFSIREGRDRLRFDFGQGRVAGRLRAALRTGRPERPLDLLEDYLDRARLAHDVASDWAWAMLTRIAQLQGEGALEQAFRVTQARWMAERYAALRAMSPAEFLALTVEGMRGHFSGPGRLGDITVSDEGDRFVLSFDPCGTGGRMRRGDEVTGSPPRWEPPYRFGFTGRPWPWSWRRTGVCYYCAHCAVVNEILPIEELGYPMRVTQHPEDPTEPCRWVIYKDPGKVPAEAYLRVGKNPPKGGS